VTATKKVMGVGIWKKWLSWLVVGGVWCCSSLLAQERRETTVEYDPEGRVKIIETRVAGGVLTATGIAPSRLRQGTCFNHVISTMPLPLSQRPTC
jgi:hypothetical protein